MAKESLEGRSALVTGASRGLGQHIATSLAEAGCKLYLTARNAQKLAAIANPLKAASSTADLADSKAVSELFQQADSSLAGIDILVNCAGVFPVAPLSESTDSDFDNCFAINVRAPFQLCRMVAAGMVEREWGRLVNIGSSSAYSGFRETSVYCASKHALLGMSRSLHDELKAHNVRTFFIAPGSIRTDMGRLVRGQNFNTFLDPAEVADFITELISHDGPMITEEVRLNRMVIK